MASMTSWVLLVEERFLFLFLKRFVAAEGEGWGAAEIWDGEGAISLICEVGDRVVDDEGDTKVTADESDVFNDVEGETWFGTLVWAVSEE